MDWAQPPSALTIEAIPLVATQVRFPPVVLCCMSFPLLCKLLSRPSRPRHKKPIKYIKTINWMDLLLSLRPHKNTPMCVCVLWQYPQSLWSSRNMSTSRTSLRGSQGRFLGKHSEFLFPAVVHHDRCHVWPQSTWKWRPSSVSLTRYLLPPQTRSRFEGARSEVYELMKRIREAPQEYRQTSPISSEGYLYVQEKRKTAPRCWVCSKSRDLIGHLTGTNLSCALNYCW